MAAEKNSIDHLSAAEYIEHAADYAAYNDHLRDEAQMLDAADFDDFADDDYDRQLEIDSQQDDWDDFFHNYTS